MGRTAVTTTPITHNPAGAGYLTGAFIEPYTIAHSCDHHFLINFLPSRGYQPRTRLGSPRALELDDGAQSTRVRELWGDDRVFLSLLRSTYREQQEQTVGDLAVRKTPTLPWEWLAQIVGDEPELGERVTEIAASTDVDALDELTRAALETAEATSPASFRPMTPTVLDAPLRTLSRIRRPTSSAQRRRRRRGRRARRSARGRTS
jgi:hypothetical protein